MIIVDTALRGPRGAGSPIRVGMIGAGFMAQGLTNQIVNSVPGMRMAADLQPQARAGRRRLPIRRARGRVVADSRRSSTTPSRAGSRASRRTRSCYALRSDRRARRRHRGGRVRRPGRARRLRARQVRRADERRARRDDRPDPPGLCREARRRCSRQAKATSRGSR